MVDHIVNFIIGIHHYVKKWNIAFGVITQPILIYVPVGVGFGSFA